MFNTAAQRMYSCVCVFVFSCNENTKNNVFSLSSCTQPCTHDSSHTVEGPYVCATTCAVAPTHAKHMAFACTEVSAVKYIPQAKIATVKTLPTFPDAVELCQPLGFGHSNNQIRIWKAHINKHTDVLIIPAQPSSLSHNIFFYITES